MHARQRKRIEDWQREQGRTGDGCMHARQRTRNKDWQREHGRPGKGFMHARQLKRIGKGMVRADW